MEEKKINNLLTGIGGFVASHLADLLLSKGEEVYGTYRWTEDLSKIKHIRDKIHLIPMDLNDMTSCIKAINMSKPDYIFHLAAQSYVPDSFIYPEETLRTNIIGTYNFLEAIRMATNEFFYDKPFDPIVHICSSSECYGVVYPDEIPIKETNPFRPGNPYGVSKIGEDMLAWMYWKNYGIKTIRTRMFTHTGPRRTMLSAEVNFASQIARIEKGLQEPVVKHGNLNSMRTWADVRDACEAYYILVRKCKPGEVYNIGGNTQHTIGECLDTLIAMSTRTDIKKELDTSLLRKDDVTLQIPDSSKFMNETGWKPKYTFEQTMIDLLNWWRNEV